MYNSTFDEIMALAEKRLENNSVNANDIVEAMMDRDSHNRPTTIINIFEEYYNVLDNKMVSSKNIYTTIKATIDTQKAAGFTTLILTFNKKDLSDCIKLWKLLNAYGKQSVEVEKHEKLNEYPTLSIMAIPLTLGGMYFMLTSSPIFWSMQASNITDEKENEIRLLFPPQSILYNKDNDFDPEAFAKLVKHEIALENMQEEQTREAAENEILEKEQYEREQAKINESRYDHGNRYSRTFDHGETKSKYEHK